MTHKQQVLAACRGDVPDCIPWIPRMDLWYNANSRAGTLPPQFRDASLRDITRAIGVGYHAVVPNFLDVRSPDDTIDRCLGIYRLKTMPFETRLHDVRREVRVDGDTTHVSYHTPVGQICGAFGYTPQMKEAGASISWISEPLLKRPADYPVLEHIFSNLEVVRTYDSYRTWQEWIGQDGVAVAFASLSGSPVHHIMRELLPMTDFYLQMHDRPVQIASLARSMERWFRQMFAALVESPAEIIFLGANYDETITYPPFFEEHILPWLRELADLAHLNGKFLLTHTDGENEGLLHLYRQCRFDIADSVCPKPMTKMTLARTMEQLPGVTIWGGIPSVAFCPDCMPDAQFDRLLDETIELSRGKTHIILGVADTTPPGASFARILRVTQKLSH